MGVLQRFERRLEGLVQGVFTKTFGGWVEPVEVAAALTREASDKKAILAAGRVLVPNSYLVELGHADAERLGEYDEPLRTELATMVTEDAQEHGWSFVGPVEVRFVEVTDLDTGAFRVRSNVVAGAVDAPQPEGHRLEVNGGSVPLGERTVIGRGEAADVQLTDTGVSRSHCVIECGATVTVTDLGSTNGTFVNGARTHTTTIGEGDRILVGATELVFRSGR